VGKARWVLVALAGAALFGGGFGAGFASSSSGTPTVPYTVPGSWPTGPAVVQALSGTVQEVNPAGDQFFVCLNGANRCYPETLNNHISWRDTQGIWQQSLPQSGYIPCMKPSSHGQKITLGLVTFTSAGDAIGSQSVVWIECLK
jgi:hypothetical protein